MTYSIAPLGGSFGALVSGFSDAQIDDRQAMARLVAALHEHAVVVVEKQNLTPERYVRFGAAFGTPETYLEAKRRHPERAEIMMLTNAPEDGRTEPVAMLWHSDGSYLETPHSVTMLYGIEAPPTGGETQFASIAMAYESLDDAMKAKIAPLSAEHAMSSGIADKTNEEGSQSILGAMSAADKAKLKRVRHPLVMEHPVTGRKSLYISSNSACAIEGMGDEAARGLLNRLKAHALQPQFRIRYRVRPGDILLWDNYQVMHAAGAIEMSAEPGKRRVMQRITTNGLPGIPAARAAA